MTALRPLSALMILLAGVAAGLVDGVMAATTPTGRAISMMPRSGYSAITPTDARALQVAQQAERLAMVLADLVVDIADAGVGNRELGELAVARRLDDRPAGGGDELVDARLVVVVGDRLRGARARDESRQRRPPLKLTLRSPEVVHRVYSRLEAGAGRASVPQIMRSDTGPRVR